MVKGHQILDYVGDRLGFFSIIRLLLVRGEWNLFVIVELSI